MRKKKISDLHSLHMHLRLKAFICRRNNVKIALVGSQAQIQRSLFVEYPFSQKLVVMSLKNMAEAVIRGMATSDLLKWRPFVFARKVFLKISPFVTVLDQDRIHSLKLF